MRKTPLKIRSAFFSALVGLLVLVIASAYLYRQNKAYQNANRRLLILNDSILSENIELRNALELKRTSSAFKGVPELFKTKENK